MLFKDLTEGKDGPILLRGKVRLLVRCQGHGGCYWKGIRVGMYTFTQKFTLDTCPDLKQLSEAFVNQKDKRVSCPKCGMPVTVVRAISKG